MTTQTRKTLLATLGLVALFAIYETVKTLLFPRMEVVTSHVISTVVVGIITIVIGQYVVKQQTSLLRERERNNQRLREALAKSSRDENLLRSIVESIDEGLIIIDGESSVLLLNDAARRLLGIGDRTVTRLTDLSRDPLIHRIFADVLSQGARGEGRLETWSGQLASRNRRILRLQAVPLRLTSGQIDGVVGTLIDISQVERLERVRQEFLSNVSHELRTPLASISAFVETLLDGGLEDPENSLRFLNTIQRNASRMRALVNDISELSAIESGATRLTLTRLPLQTIVNEVFSALGPRATKYGVWLENRVDPELDIVADRRRLEQILVNLVDNGIKFNHPGGRVTVSAMVSGTPPGGVGRGDGRVIEISVRDTGPGIASEHLARVFERFYRVDKARSREVGGTGLGLAIVKHLARLHGGEADVRSEVGEGSEFIIRIPVGPAVDAVNAVDPPSEAPEAGLGEA